MSLPLRKTRRWCRRPRTRLRRHRLDDDRVRVPLRVLTTYTYQANVLAGAYYSYRCYPPARTTAVAAALRTTFWTRTLSASLCSPPTSGFSLVRCCSGIRDFGGRAALGRIAGRLDLDGVQVL